MFRSFDVVFYPQLGDATGAVFTMPDELREPLERVVSWPCTNTTSTASDISVLRHMSRRMMVPALYEVELPAGARTCVVHFSTPAVSWKKLTSHKQPSAHDFRALVSLMEKLHAGGIHLPHIDPGCIALHGKGKSRTAVVTDLRRCLRVVGVPWPLSCLYHTLHIASVFNTRMRMSLMKELMVPAPRRGIVSWSPPGDVSGALHMRGWHRTQSVFHHTTTDTATAGHVCHCTHTQYMILELLYGLVDRAQFIDFGWQAQADSISKTGERVGLDVNGTALYVIAGGLVLAHTRYFVILMLLPLIRMLRKVQTHTPVVLVKHYEEISMCPHPGV